MKNVSISKENVRANVVFFGDYDVVRISDDNDRYAELVSKLVKKKFITSSAQEFSMQVNMNPNGVRIKEDIPERKVIFRPVFLSIKTTRQTGGLHAPIRGKYRPTSKGVGLHFVQTILSLIRSYP